MLQIQCRSVKLECSHAENISIIADHGGIGK